MTDQAARRSDLDVLYRLLGELGIPRLLADPGFREACPARGVYFFFEDGEHREDGVTPRVVRVGTHALKAGSATTVWKRLSQHRGTLAGARPGAGNHRSSVFRLHVGTALIARGAPGAAAAESTWTRGLSARGVRRSPPR